MSDNYDDYMDNLNRCCWCSAKATHSTAYLCLCDKHYAYWLTIPCNSCVERHSTSDKCDCTCHTTGHYYGL
jgi:hypothetical protein